MITPGMPRTSPTAFMSGPPHYNDALPIISWSSKGETTAEDPGPNLGPVKDGSRIHPPAAPTPSNPIAAGNNFGPNTRATSAEAYASY